MQATLRNARLSAKKMNLIAELVRKQNAKKATIFLQFTPKKGAKILNKVIKSAISNATNNQKLDENLLYIKEVKVSKAFTIKRFIAGSRGRARPIEKRSSHIHVYLDIETPDMYAKKTTKDVKKKVDAPTETATENPTDTSVETSAKKPKTRVSKTKSTTKK